MKQKQLVFFLAVLACAPMCAQLTRLHNAPRGDDEIVKMRVSYKDPGRDGEAVIWDFGELVAIDPEYTLTYYDIPPINDSTYLVLRDSIPANEVAYGDLTAGVEHFTAYYARLLEGDTLVTLGHENPVVLMRHNPPLLTMKFPFSYGEEIEKDYKSNGFYSSKEPVTTEGNIKIKADAFGKMVLPSGDTLNHVLRIRSLQTIADADTTYVNDTIPRLKMESENFKWYVKGYRYPVFEAIRIFDISDTAKTEIFATSFFYPPIDHLYLELDSANLAVLDSLWNIGNIPPDLGDDDDENGGGNGNNPPCNLNLKTNYFPNPVKDLLHVEYYFECQANVTITLFDMNGIPVVTIPKELLNKGMYRDEINCTALPPGMYVLRLSVGGEVVSGIISKK